MGITNNLDEYKVITLDNVVPYLLEKKMISVDSIVDNNLKLIDLSKRNRNIMVTRSNGTNYLLKQTFYYKQYKITPLEIESRFYELVHKNYDYKHIRGIIPNMISFDPDQNILTLELISQARTLREYFHNIQDNEINSSLHKDIFAKLGKMLAQYHSCFRNCINDKNMISFIKDRMPFMFSLLHPSPEIFSRLSPANLKFLKIIQRYPELNKQLKYLGREWQTETIIHGDLKWDNIVFSYSKYQSISLKIIDWELVSFGDPAWDIAGVFQDLISFWLQTSPIFDENKLPEKTTNIRLLNAQEIIRTFWYNYLSYLDINESESDELLLRCTKYSAIRLLQKSWESLQSVSELTNISVYMIQMSANIFSSPYEAIHYLYGIPLKNYMD